MTMATAARPASSDKTLVVHIPMSFQRHGGQKLVVVPNDGPRRPIRSRDESRLIKLLARAFHWKRLIDTCEYTTLTDLAAAENVDKSNLSKVLRLTLLAPHIVEAILDGAEPDHLQIERLLQPFSIAWKEQRESLLNPASNRR